jgi:methionyl-tRNA synthetase
MNPNAVLDAVWKLVREANRFVEVQAPWHLAKDASKRAELEVTIYALLETMRQLSVLLFPVIPSKACEIWRQLGAKGSPEDVHLDDLKSWGGLDANLKVAPGDPVFPRIEEVNVAEEKAKEDLISFSEFQKLKLRVANIDVAERVKGADRLLRLQISLGDEQRQIVAGIAEYYEPDALVGRQIVVVANLEPATIRGVESQGMLLAASDDHGLALVTPDSEIGDGAEVS